MRSPTAATAPGRSPRLSAMKPSPSVLKAFDLLYKPIEEYTTRTATGGVVTLAASCIMLLLFLSETRLFLTTRTEHELVVDTTRGETIQINLDVSHDVHKGRLEADGSPHVEPPARTEIGHNEVLAQAAAKNRTDASYCGSCYGANEVADECCNTCGSVRERYRQRGWAFSSAGVVAQCAHEGHAEAVAAQDGEGCRFFGHFEVNKVAGNFHFAPGRSFQQGAMHVHDLQAFAPDTYFNLSHSITRLSFGPDYPGLVNPLDGSNQWQLGPHLMFQYFLKVVPTTFLPHKGGSPIKSAQFSVTEHPKPVDILSGRNLPGVFLFYDLSPLAVRFRERRPPFLSFITNLCAILGGVFTVSGLIDATLFHTHKLLKKKVEIGKQT